ncbi:MAG: hypothetical protein ABIZ49_00560 [Opitutaceae bacterium]
MKILLRFLALFMAIDGVVRAAEPAAGTGLDVSLLPTTQYAHRDIFFRTPSGRGPAIAVVREIAPGQEVDLLGLVRGFAVDAGGLASVTYDLVVHLPNGKTQGAPARVVVADKVKVDPGAILFPRGVPRFKTDPGDLPGEYRFEILVRDHVSGSTVSKSATLTVTETDTPLPLPANTDPLQFMSEYYQRPRPRLALSVLTALSHTPFAERKADGQGTLLGFYAQLFADNPWLMPQFEQRFIATTDANERRMLALVLAYARRDDPKLGQGLPDAAALALAEARKESLPLPSLEPMSGGQLDLQWGTFLASGRFQPIGDLVAVVQNYLPYRGKLEEMKLRLSKPKIAPPEVMKEIVFNSAVWSLGSNAHQHKLVRDYLTGIEQAKETPPEVKAQLQTALAWRPREKIGPPAK